MLSWAEFSHHEWGNFVRSAKKKVCDYACVNESSMLSATRSLYRRLRKPPRWYNYLNFSKISVHFKDTYNDFSIASGYVPDDSPRDCRENVITLRYRRYFYLEQDLIARHCANAFHFEDFAKRAPRDISHKESAFLNATPCRTCNARARFPRAHLPR